ncbi:MAG: DUF308 domain-containing protein [Bacillota bacterium]|nr:DUF308 domain-containing protein [Bacillota bacterium]
MKKIFTPSNKEIRLCAILYCVIGACLLLLNNNILTIIARVLGLFICGAGFLLMWFYLSKTKNLTKISVMIGFPLAVVGLLLLMSPESILSIVPVFVAILFIIHSLFTIKNVLRFKKRGFNKWTYHLASALFILLLGLIVLFDPLHKITILLKLIGIGFVIQAILLFVEEKLAQKYENQEAQE